MSPNDIIQEVINECDISLNDFLGKKRHHELVVARKWAAIRLKDELGLSLNDIGRRLNRDHSTCLYYLKFKGRIKN